MKSIKSTLSVAVLTLSIASSASAGTITGSRTNRTGTITGSAVGTITGSRTGTITGSRVGTITGSSVGTTLRTDGEGVLQSQLRDDFAAYVLNALFRLVW